MKKMLLVVAVLLMAAPAMATVNITVAQVGSSLMFDIGYNATGETQLVRAFALDVTVDNDAKITAISNVKTGESTAASKGFGIFPGTIDINSTTGLVDSFGTPVAPVTDPGALGGLNTAGVTLEMGSLYKGDANKPAKSGILCRLTVDKACCMTVNTNATRGNVVLEDANEATTDVPQTACIQIGCTVPTLTTCATADAAILAAGLTVGNKTSQSSDTVPAGNVISQNPIGGTVVDCGTAVDYVCSTGPDLNCIPNDAQHAAQRAAFAEYVARGLDPSCWCAAPKGSGYQCVGDIDGKTEGTLTKYRVSQNDLNILILAANWNKKLTQNPNPCADIDHKTEGTLTKYRVSQNDLNIMIAAAHWNKKDTQLGIPGPCPKND